MRSGPGGPERNQRTPSLIVYLAGTPDSELAGPAIDKIGSRFVLTYDNLPGTSPRADFTNGSHCRGFTAHVGATIDDQRHRSGGHAKRPHIRM